MDSKKKKPEVEPEPERIHTFGKEQAVCGTNFKGQYVEGTVNMRGWMSSDNWKTHEEYIIVHDRNRKVLTKCCGSDLVKL